MHLLGLRGDPPLCALRDFGFHRYRMLTSINYNRFASCFYTSLLYTKGLNQTISMVGPSPLQASTSSASSPPPKSPTQKTQYTSLASLMEHPPRSKGRLSYGESTHARPPKRHVKIAQEPSRSRSRDGRSNGHEGPVQEKKKGRLSAWKMMALTVSMGGSQVSSSKISALCLTHVDRLDSVSQRIRSVSIELILK
jgi:hypothetical protein